MRPITHHKEGPIRDDVKTVEDVEARPHVLVIFLPSLCERRSPLVREGGVANYDAFPVSEKSFLWR